MNAKDVLDVLHELTRHDVQFWLDGGWGVDALAGRETRQHADLDMVVPLGEVTTIVSALTPLGYQVALDDLPTRIVLETDQGQKVDLHTVEFDSSGNGVQHGAAPDGGDCIYPGAGLKGEGRIAGVRVRCLTPELSVAHHVGYAPLAKDRHNVELLHREFGVPLPEAYR